MTGPPSGAAARPGATGPPGATGAPGGAAAAAGPAAARIRADRVYLGWQYALLNADPGPPPRRPVPPESEQLNPGWVAAQRREEDRLNRPLKLACAAALAAAAALLALWLAGPLNLALAAVGVAACLAAAARCGQVIVAGERQLRTRVAAEQQRVEVIREAQQRRLATWQESHARRFREWQARRGAFERQQQWYAVSLPADIDRIDVAGGTLPGWSAMLTMIAAPRLDAGGQVTVLDLTEGGVAGDLLAAAGQCGIEPLVWVLPRDLPRLDLGTGLSREALADLLAAAVSAGDHPGAPADPSRDNAILERVLAVLGDEPRIAAVAAAMRALAQIGDPRDDMRAGLLTGAQLEQITAMYGRSAADRVVVERAWAIESRLRKLAGLASEPVRLPPSRLRVAWLDRQAGAFGNQVIGTYLTVAMTQLLRQAPAGRRWDHTVCVLGADRLRAEVLDGLCDACEMSATGLVVAYRSIPAHVQERLGRGNAAVAFMRLGNADDAKVASEQIGTEHRFVISQLTDTVGTSVTDTGGDSYTSTVGSSDSVADSLSVTDTTGRSRGSGRSREDPLAPFGHFTSSTSRDTSFSRAASGSRSVTEGISDSTAWGLSTSRAVGGNASVARGAQRSREFLVEAHELQQLPPSAILVCYPGPGGRQVVLADANPAIIGLPTATLADLAQARRAPGAGRAGAPLKPPGPVKTEPAGPRVAEVPVQDGAEPPPNLGPPPRRLDWRTYRR
jgi:hypothetical protein